METLFNIIVDPSSKVVALMGAHTFGQPHFQISMFPYTWTRSLILRYGTGDGAKMDEFSENFQRGGGVKGFRNFPENSSVLYCHLSLSNLS